MIRGSNTCGSGLVCQTSLLNYAISTKLLASPHHKNKEATSTINLQISRVCHRMPWQRSFNPQASPADSMNNRKHAVYQHHPVWVTHGQSSATLPAPVPLPRRDFSSRSVFVCRDSFLASTQWRGGRRQGHGFGPRPRVPLHIGA